MATLSRKEQLQALLAEDPTDPFVRYGLAMEWLSEGNLQTVVRCLEELMQLHPEYVPAYLQAGQVLVRLDQEEQARQIYRAGIAQAQKQGDRHAADEMERFLDAIS
jgi:Tfp pilus assembly protein PilF